MFDSNILLLLKQLIIQIVIPLIPGILFLWIFFKDKFTGLGLYLLGWFIGSAVVSFSLFNIQFVWFGIGILEYILLLVILLAILMIQGYKKKSLYKSLIQTLKIPSEKKSIIQSYKQLNKAEKIGLRAMSIFIIIYVLTTLVWVASFPSYADDSFGNWHQPVINILYDGGVHLFGERTEILARNRLGYPIMIPILKAVFARFAGGYNDIYANIRQWLVYLFGSVFIIRFTFQKTKKILLSLLPIFLISCLPLVFLHTAEGYFDLASAIYSIIIIICLIEYIHSKKLYRIPLALVFGSTLAYLKNDGIIIYFPAIVLAFLISLLSQKTLGSFFKKLFKDKHNLWKSIGFVAYFFLPFLLVKAVHKLGFNQAAGGQADELANTIHREIFDQTGKIFLRYNNYNIIIGIILAILIYIVHKKRLRKNFSKKLILWSTAIMFVMFTLVFLLTANYKRFLDQTTVNRVYTMVFLIFLAFSGYLISDAQANQ